MKKEPRRLAGFLALVTVAGSLLWAVWMARALEILSRFANAVPRLDVWLYDFNVYHAAAGQLLDHGLYRGILVQPGHELPIGVFNYPPLAAAWAIPFLPFGREPGGVAWLMVGVLATSLGAVLGARALRLSWPWAWALAGLTMAIYAKSPYIAADIALGNNNHLMLALVAGFALAHVRGHQRTAGILLALAIGTKLWPVALLVLLLRERRWPELRWTGGVLALQGIATLVWLGPDMLGPMLPAVLGQNLGREQGVAVVVWTTWARYVLAWWPVWGSYAVAATLLLLPATGRFGLGLGIVAGLSLNSNLWHHYGPVFVLGFALIGTGLLERFNRPVAAGLDGRRRRSLRGVAQDEGAGVGAVLE